MLWRIDGSDRETGVDRLAFIEADNLDSALGDPAATALMVFASRPATEAEAAGVRKKKKATTMARPVIEIPPPSPNGAPRASADAEITSVAKSLTNVGGLMEALGALSMLGSALLIAVTLMKDWPRDMLWAAIAFLFWGFLSFAAGVALHMLAAMGIVLRDIRRK